MSSRVLADREARPLVRIALLFPDGANVVRDYCATLSPAPGGGTRVDFVEKPPVMKRPPPWLVDPFQEHEGTLVVYGGKVKPGHTAEARLFIGYAGVERQRIILPTDADLPGPLPGYPSS